MRHARVVLAVLVAASVACGGGGGGGSGQPGGGTPGPVTTAKGAALEPGASATVTSAGGSVSSSDGRLLLTIPAGALTPDTVVTVQRITNHAPGGKGVAYRLLPDGLTFNAGTSAGLTWNVTAADLKTIDVGQLGMAWQDATGKWQWLRQPVRDGGAKTVAVTTTHFTDFAGVSPVLLQPLAATVSKGGSVALEVVACYEPDLVGSLAPLYAWDCDSPLAPLVTVQNWSVNGQPGGTPAFGTVASTGGLTATYTAPGSTPTPNPVAVTVQTDAASGRPGTTLFSLITVDRPPTLHGSIQFTGTFGVGISATVSVNNVTLTCNDVAPGIPDDGPDMTLYDLTGDLEVPNYLDLGTIECCADGLAPPPCATPTVTRPTTAVVNVYKTTPPTMTFAVTEAFTMINACQVKAGPVVAAMYFAPKFGTFGAGCMPNAMLKYPVSDVVTLVGHHAFDCFPYGTDVATGSWDFH